MADPDSVDELRALAALEVALDALIAERVANAKNVGGLSWDDIAAAVGVTKSGAWKRWRDATEVQEPTRGPTRHLRRHGDRLELTSGAKTAVPSLAQQLAGRVLRDEESDPWASALRAALSGPRLPFSAHRTPGGTRFYLSSGNLVLTCIEPGAETGAGGIVATVLPSGGLREDESPARTRRLASDGLVPPPRAQLRQLVADFVDDLLCLVPVDGSPAPSAPA